LFIGYHKRFKPFVAVGGTPPAVVANISNSFDPALFQFALPFPGLLSERPGPQSGQPAGGVVNPALQFL